MHTSPGSPFADLTHGSPDLRADQDPVTLTDLIVSFPSSTEDGAY